MLYDSCIIGTGPAGLSSALTLKANQKSFLWIGSRTLSDKVERAEYIGNYPGFSGVSGSALNAAFLRQIADMQIEIQERMVTSVQSFNGHYAIMAGNDFFETRTVILATGVAATGTLPGEAALLGRGVSYCATCDGGLYRGKTIAVISNAARFLHEVHMLAALAGKLYFIPMYREFQPDALQEENAEILSQPVVAVNEANGRVCSITLKNQDELPVDGVFCLRDSISLQALLQGLALEDGHIRVNRQMETNLPGCFAAGDCTGRPYQYAKAVGEGNAAAHSVILYLSLMNEKRV